MSVTIVAEEGWLADAAATAIIVAGISGWSEIATKLELNQVLITDEQGQVVVQRFYPWTDWFVEAAADGYLANGVDGSTDTTSLVLAAAVSYDSCSHGRGRVGVDANGTRYGFSFERGEETVDMDSADLIPGGSGEMRTGSGVGAIGIAGSSYCERYYGFHRNLQAPDHGYAPNVTMPAEGEDHAYFILRMADAWAKLSIYAGSHSGIDDSWSITFDWVLQSDSSNRILPCPHPTATPFAGNLWGGPVTWDS